MRFITDPETAHDNMRPAPIKYRTTVKTSRFAVNLHYGYRYRSGLARLLLYLLFLFTISVIGSESNTAVDSLKVVTHDTFFTNLHHDILYADTLHIPSMISGDIVDTLFEMGRRYYTKKKWLEALLLFEMVEKTRLGSRYSQRINLLAGICYMEIKNYSEAVIRIKKAFSGFSTIKDHLIFLLAQARFFQGDYSKALYNYNKLVTSFRTSCYYNESIKQSLECLIALNRPRDVLKKISEFQNRLSSDPAPTIDSTLFAYFRWYEARAYGALKQYEKEAKILTYLLINPHIINKRAQIKKRIDQLTLSGVAFYPLHGTSLLQYVNKLYSFWTHDEVIQLIEKTVENGTLSYSATMSSVDLQLYYYLACSYFHMGSYAPAESLLTLVADNAKKINIKQYQNIAFQLARTQLRKGDITAAIERFEYLHKKYPESRRGRQALYYTSWAYAEQNSYAHALRCIQQYQRRYRLSRSMQNTARWMDAWFTYCNTDYKLALRRFKNIAKNISNHSYTTAAKYWTGRCLQKLDRRQQAREVFQALAADENTFTYYRLAAIQQLHNDTIHSETVNPVPVSDTALSESGLWWIPAWWEPALDTAYPKNPQPQKQIVQPKQCTRSVSPKDGIYDNSSSYHIDSITLITKKTDNDLNLFPDINDRAAMTLNEQFLNYSDDLCQKYCIDIFPDQKKLDTIAEKYHKFSAPLRKAIVWHSLGDHHRTGIELSRFTDQVIQMNTNSKLQKSEYIIDDNEESFWRQVIVLFYDIGYYNKAYRLLHFFTVRKRWRMLPPQDRQRLYYPVAYSAECDKYARSYGVPAALLSAVMRTESRFDSSALSSVYAIGLMQILWRTGARIADELDDTLFHSGSLLTVDRNIQYGAWYLSRLLEKYKGQIPLAVAAYNAGPLVVDTWLKRNSAASWDEFIESIRFSQTRFYVKKVLQTMAIYKSIYYGELAAWDLLQHIDATPNTYSTINW